MSDKLIRRIKSTTDAPLVIAELGINHQGSSEVAEKLIFESSVAGVHAIKFQYRNLKNVYASQVQEIGDELLESEIQRNFLSPEEILRLADRAKERDLAVGISFFHVDDCRDFGEDVEAFDFYKIPSAELLNFNLVDYLTSLNRLVLVSTGMHWEHEIELALSRIQSDLWVPMHCVSNYPVALHNANWSYIKHLRDRWQRPAGFSSHERDWEHVLLSLRFGPRVIERHITLNKTLPGLDQSSSSTPDEFSRLMKILESETVTPNLIDSRIPNQGELLNRQNLGRSLYFSDMQRTGNQLNQAGLIYRSPKVGLDPTELEKFNSRRLLIDGLPGQPLVSSHLTPPLKLNDEHFQFLTEKRLALPVRIHDFESLQKEIPSQFLELHLSFSEIPLLDRLIPKIQGISLSVHLPDYVDALNLIDPLSPNDDLKRRSRVIIDQVSRFVALVQQSTGKTVPIVGSFPQRVQKNHKSYYEDLSSMINSLRDIEIELTAQWLPPFAWYFGGSHEIDVFNKTKDLEAIRSHNIPICMDTSHLILGSNFFRYDKNEILNTLACQIRYFHLSDAVGFDGEGTHFELQDPDKRNFFQKIVKSNSVKVIEVWQGHLDNFRGFKQAIIDLFMLNKEEFDAKN